MSDDLDVLHQQGKLTQTCPSCGTSEAAGAYCTKCSTPTGRARWFRGEASEAQRAARARRGTEPQPEPDRGSLLAEAAKPGQMAGFWA